MSGNVADDDVDDDVDDDDVDDVDDDGDYGVDCSQSLLYFVPQEM